MDAAQRFMNSLRFPEDFVAVTYNEWQQQEHKKKPSRLVDRLKKRSSTIRPGKKKNG